MPETRQLRPMFSQDKPSRDQYQALAEKGQQLHTLKGPFYRDKTGKIPQLHQRRR